MEAGHREDRQAKGLSGARLRTTLGQLKVKFETNTVTGLAGQNCYIMKKIITILFFMVLATLFIAMLRPAPLVAETSIIIVRDIVVAPQIEDRLFNKIAMCESKNDPLADNPYSTAKGRFQFLDGTWNYYAPKLWAEDWKNKNVLSYEDNTDLAWYVYTTHGTRDWEADPKSFDCWKGEIPNALYKNIF